MAISIVGLTQHQFNDAIADVMSEVKWTGAKEGTLRGELVRFEDEPDNEHDPHAVAAWIGRFKIGYISKNTDGETRQKIKSRSINKLIFNYEKPYAAVVLNARSCKDDLIAFAQIVEREMNDFLEPFEQPGQKVTIDDLELCRPLELRDKARKVLDVFKSLKNLKTESDAALERRDFQRYEELERTIMKMQKYR